MVVLVIVMALLNPVMEVIVTYPVPVEGAWRSWGVVIPTFVICWLLVRADPWARWALAVYWTYMVAYGIGQLTVGNVVLVTWMRGATLPGAFDFDLSFGLLLFLGIVYYLALLAFVFLLVRSPLVEAFFQNRRRPNAAPVDPATVSWVRVARTRWGQQHPRTFSAEGKQGEQTVIQLLFLLAGVHLVPAFFKLFEWEDRLVGLTVGIAFGEIVLTVWLMIKLFRGLSWARTVVAVFLALDIARALASVILSTPMIRTTRFASDEMVDSLWYGYMWSAAIDIAIALVIGAMLFLSRPVQGFFDEASDVRQTPNGDDAPSKHEAP